jgi:hypothetical protein
MFWSRGWIHKERGGFTHKGGGFTHREGVDSHTEGVDSHTEGVVRSLKATYSPPLDLAPPRCVPEFSSGSYRVDSHTEGVDSHTEGVVRSLKATHSPPLDWLLLAVCQHFPRDLIGWIHTQRGWFVV